jgi:hypothetical protein
MEKYAYNTWISDLKSLVVSERVELVGSAAYHPLLTKVTSSIAESQIILNEYSLGYFLGLHQGFEGEPGVMLKNLKGFFPPELAVNREVASTISGLGYEWIIADEHSIGETRKSVQYPFMYKFTITDLPIMLLVRDKSLSDMFAFKRDAHIEDIQDYLQNISSASRQEYVGIIALDAETFGHHNPNGLHVISYFLDYLDANLVSVMSLSSLSAYMSPVNVEDVSESTWGQSFEDADKGIIYPLWVDNSSLINKNLLILNDLLQKILDSSTSISFDTLSSVGNFSNILNSLKNDKSVDLHKCLSSDVLWWSSNGKINEGITLYDTDYIKTHLLFVQKSLGFFNETSAKKELTASLALIDKLLDSLK